MDQRDVEPRDERSEDEWLGELDWDDTGSPPPRAGEPEAPWSPPPFVVGPRASIQRRRAALVLGLVVLAAVVIVVALVVFRGSPKKAATPPATVPTTTTAQTTTTATTTPVTTPATPAPLQVTLPPGGTLRRGDTRVALVKKLQRVLIALGDETVKADGDFGATTEAAVGAFQRANGLPDDGIVGKTTANAMNDALAGQTG